MQIMQQTNKPTFLFKNTQDYCWIIGVVSNETNTDVRIYNLFIRWSALLDVQVGTEDIEGNYIGFLYNRNKGRECCDMGQNDTIGKIELIPFSVLSENKTNC